MIALSTVQFDLPRQGVAVRTPTPCALAVGEVHVWRMDLDVPGWQLEHLLELMSCDERERANRYVFDHDRSRFIAARGMLRRILASYTGIPSTSIRFSYTAHGKPMLAEDEDVSFNLSHSGSEGLLAVARGRRVGIDIERIRPEIDVLGLGQSTFSANEYARLVCLPGHQQRTGFYACWTRKEAYIMARGEGLSYPLDAFDVSLEPGVPAALLWSAEGIAETKRWAFVPIDAPAGYATALVVESPDDYEETGSRC